mmetsp:Transcript_56755/g.159353  ORF Transcript_56755/g.159353 Transcript_56755/m.159353 type:complete len:268 (-) Transcript_56755:142-945(-)
MARSPDVVHREPPLDNDIRDTLVDEIGGLRGRMVDAIPPLSDSDFDKPCIPDQLLKVVKADVVIVRLKLRDAEDVTAAAPQDLRSTRHLPRRKKNLLHLPLSGIEQVSLPAEAGELLEGHLALSVLVDLAKQRAQNMCPLERYLLFRQRIQAADYRNVLAHSPRLQHLHHEVLVELPILHHVPQHRLRRPVLLPQHDVCETVDELALRHSRVRQQKLLDLRRAQLRSAAPPERPRAAANISRRPPPRGRAPGDAEVPHIQVKPGRSC